MHGIVHRKELTPSSPHRWEISYSSFGPQKLMYSASCPTIGIAGDRRPDANRSVMTRTGLIGRAAPVAPFTRGIPRNHLHQSWVDHELHEDWREKPFYGQSPPYLHRMKRHLASQQRARQGEGVTGTAEFNGWLVSRQASRQRMSPSAFPREWHSAGTVSPRSATKAFGDVSARVRAGTPMCCTYGLQVDFVQFGSTSRTSRAQALERAKSIERTHHAPTCSSAGKRLASCTVAQQIGWTRAEGL